VAWDSLSWMTSGFGGNNADERHRVSAVHWLGVASSRPWLA
jgi:hypothetical protein